MAEVQPSVSKTEYTSHADKLEAMTDEELERIVIQGVNLHVESSEASIAKRVLDNRRQKKQVQVAENVQTVTEQLRASHEEILKINRQAGEILGVLTKINNNFLPRQPWYIRIGVFILGTVILGIALNLVANYIGLYWLNWR